MRIRNIKPEFWRSDGMDEHDWHTRLVFIGLWSYVDDNGVGLDKVASIAADLFAGDLSVEPTETLRRVSTALEELQSAGQIRRYVARGKRFLYITGWEEHQRVHNPNKPRYPIPTCEDVEPTETLPKSSVAKTEILGTGSGGQGVSGSGEEEANASSSHKHVTKASRISDDFAVTEAMVEWAREKCPNVNGPRETERFVNYWQAASGKTATKRRWDSAWRQWMLKAQDDAERRGGSNGVRVPTTTTRVSAAMDLANQYAAEEAGHDQG